MHAAAALDSCLWMCHWPYNIIILLATLATAADDGHQNYPSTQLNTHSVVLLSLTLLAVELPPPATDHYSTLIMFYNP